MKASYHALTRFMERSEHKHPKKAKKAMLELARSAVPSFGYVVGNKIRLYDGEHFTTGEWVFVIKNNVIITCFPADKSICMPITG